jgi:hypothetical protein
MADRRHLAPMKTGFDACFLNSAGFEASLFSKMAAFVFEPDIRCLPNGHLWSRKCRRPDPRPADTQKSDQNADGVGNLQPSAKGAVASKCQFAPSSAIAFGQLIRLAPTSAQERGRASVRLPAPGRADGHTPANAGSSGMYFDCTPYNDTEGSAGRHRLAPLHSRSRPFCLQHGREARPTERRCNK